MQQVSVWFTEIDEVDVSHDAETLAEQFLRPLPVVQHAQQTVRQSRPSLGVLERGTLDFWVFGAFSTGPQGLNVPFLGQEVLLGPFGPDCDEAGVVCPGGVGWHYDLRWWLIGSTCWCFRDWKTSHCRLSTCGYSSVVMVINLICISLRNNTRPSQFRICRILFQLSKIPYGKE